MKRFLDFKNKNILSVILSCAAAIAALIALIIYASTGVTNYTANKLDSGVIVFAIFGIVVSAVSVIFDFKLVKHVAFLAFMVALFDYVVFEIDYIGSIFVGIDNTLVTAPFVLTLLTLLIATIVSLVCAIITKDPVGEEKDEGKNEPAKEEEAV